MSEVTSKEFVPPSSQEHTKGGWLVVLKDLLCINMSDIAIVIIYQQLLQNIKSKDIRPSLSLATHPSP
jgi:hypothetical protein